MTIDDLIKDETARRTLEPEGIAKGVEGGDIVYHHEWARNDAQHLICVMWAGFGKVYLHNLDAKTLDVTRGPLGALGLRLMDTD